MTCTHHFVQMGHRTKSIPIPGTSGGYSTISGVRAGCVMCGELRAVYDDGTTETLYADGKRPKSE